MIFKFLKLEIKFLKILKPLGGAYDITNRIVEGYIGEYASGKSEVAVNRAIDLFNQGHQDVTLVDLDIVEPCYTLRPIKNKLQSLGLHVLAWETRETIGLGEAGNVLRAENKWALRRDGDVILDIGYGAEGAKTLNLLEGAKEEENLHLLVVVNIARPMTATVKDIVEYVNGMGTVHGLINNSHLGDDTDIDIIQEGAQMVSQAAKQLGLPLVATAAVQELAEQMNWRDCMGNPMRGLKRYMPCTLW